MLSCLDAATGRQVWASTLVDRTLCTVAIADGLLYSADYSGNLHCFDAQTGRRHWSHQLGSGVWCASPIVYASKVYISTEDRDFWTFAAAKEKHILGKNKVDSMAITPLAADGVLYLPTQKRLCAYRTSPTAGAAN
jgi:outer membrane protein assembly factor BamB